ncbi:ATP-binding protein [Pseudomonas sp. F3-2]|uniref:sensor histidine kinase n=1 Tax=Pseudomonas sp. F3-2 TaxID=3141539 RepID=UPI00315DC7B1
MRENESFRQRTSRGFNPFTSRAITALNGHANSGPLIHVSKSRYETWLIWAIGLVVTAGIAVINTAPHHRDIAATVIYVTLLLMAANVFTIRTVIGVSLLCMATIVVMFFVDHGYQDWDSFTSFVRCLTALSAIGFLAARAKQASDHLRQHQIYLTGAQCLSQTGSVTFSGVTELMAWSEESARIFEYPINIPVSKSMILARTPVEDHGLIHHVFNLAAQREPQIEIRHRLLMPDGRIKHIHMVATALFVQDDRVEYLGAVMDVTERMQAEEMLYRTQAQLTHMCRVTTLGELTASIAHEVNQPLTAVISSADGCRRWLDRPQPDIAEAIRGLQRINDNAHRASEVISRVRALARKSDPIRRPEPINEIVRESLALLQYEMAHNHIRPHLDLTAEDSWVSADRIQLQQVLINLLVNARQAMSGIEQKRRMLHVRTFVTPYEVIVEVADCGPGIAPDMLPSLFTPFFTTRESGMGMGLSICRSIIDSHDGKIWAQNNASGASFFISLPTVRRPW